MIEAKKLTKRFDNTVALDEISFSIASGSVFGLVGSNGAGKSTFLRTLAGIYKPDGGEVLVDGAASFENSDTKSKIFFISDYPYFLPQATLQEMADFFARIYPNWSKKRFEELCTLFPIDKKSKIMITNQSAPQTPLQRKLAQTGQWLGIGALIICFIIFVMGLFQHASGFGKMQQLRQHFDKNLRRIDAMPSICSRQVYDFSLRKNSKVGGHGFINNRTQPQIRRHSSDSKGRAKVRLRIRSN